VRVAKAVQSDARVAKAVQSDARDPGTSDEVHEGCVFAGSVLALEAGAPADKRVLAHLAPVLGVPRAR
jgi:hypothetical protein